MSVTLDEVRRIASLSGLRVTPEEERELATEMAELVRFAGEMEAFDPSESAGASPALEGAADEDAADGVREAADEPGECLPRQTVLANAPDHHDGHVRLPAVERRRRGPEESLE